MITYGDGGYKPLFKDNKSLFLYICFNYFSRITKDLDDLSIDEILKLLEELLKKGNHFNWFILGIFALYYISRLLPNSVKLDIVPVTIIIDGRKCKGIIDLINSNGLYLKFFYFFNSNVRSVIIETRGYMIQEIYACLICSEVPYPHSLYYIL